jgi:hypothetical protein
VYLIHIHVLSLQNHLFHYIKFFLKKSQKEEIQKKNGKLKISFFQIIFYKNFFLSL